MFSQWDLVQPHVWFPMSSLEQSLMVVAPTSAEFRELADPPTAPPSTELSAEDDEFFKDLPRSAGATSATATPHHKATQKGATSDPRAFSTYSFSSSSTVDPHGRRVTSARRRYADSAGRLKALLERDVDGVKMRSLWHRQGFEDKEGSIETTCSSGTPEDFEALWLSTPFGEAQQRAVKLQTKPGSGDNREAAQP